MGANLPQGAASHGMGHHQAKRDGGMARQARLRCVVAMQENVVCQRTEYFLVR
jgi:hypothetical protein